MMIGRQMLPLLAVVLVATVIWIASFHRVANRRYGTMTLPESNRRGDRILSCLVPSCPLNGALRGDYSQEWYPNIRAAIESLSNATLPPKGRFKE